MKVLKKQELIKIDGGTTNVSGTLVNAVSSLINTVLGVGRVIGTSIRMAITGARC